MAMWLRQAWMRPREGVWIGISPTEAPPPPPRYRVRKRKEG